MKKATTLPPMCNYPGEGYKAITQADWDKKHKDYKGSRVVVATPTAGAHRVRSGMFGGSSGYGRLLGDPTSIRPTPAALADDLVRRADIRQGHTILEPSAGTGNLVRACMKADGCARVTAVEIAPALWHQLQERFGRGNYNCTVLNADFLAFKWCDLVGGKVDRVVMNPPFANGADVAHVLHARTFLKPGGRLVAIVANGPRQRAALEPIASEWIDLPAGSFASEGTGVNTAMVVMDV